MNEPPIPDARDDDLDRRIQHALRRHFAVPASLDALVARTRPRAVRRLGPRLAARMGLVAAAAAAASLLLAWWVGTGGSDDAPEVRSRVAEVATPAAVPLVAEASFCRVIGPLQDGLPEAGAVHRPDLVRLYRDMDDCQRDSTGTACGDADLAARLSATYGQPLELRPEAAGLLHGPYGSSEWPTGTIVTGPGDGPTSVLVAERDAALACCVDVGQPPEGSGLRCFKLKVGEVVLTEITPCQEPRLLAFFQ